MEQFLLLREGFRTRLVIISMEALRHTANYRCPRYEPILIQSSRYFLILR